MRKFTSYFVACILLTLSTILFFIFNNIIFCLLNLLTYIFFVFADFYFVNLSAKKYRIVFSIIIKTLIILVLFISYGVYINSFLISDVMKLFVWASWYVVFVYFEMIVSIITLNKLKLSYGRVVRALTYFPLFIYITIETVYGEPPEIETANMALKGVSILGAFILMFEFLIPIMYNNYFGSDLQRINIKRIGRENRFKDFKKKILSMFSKCKK